MTPIYMYCLSILIINTSQLFIDLFKTLNEVVSRSFLGFVHPVGTNFSNAALTNGTHEQGLVEEPFVWLYWTVGLEFTLSPFRVSTR